MTTPGKSRSPILTTFTKPDERLSEEQLVRLVESAVPPYAYRGSPREWTWTRPSGVWKLNLTFDDWPRLVARLECAAAPKVIVRLTRREINAALRWLVLVDAIDRHPDDPQPIMQESDYA